ncbi:MAG: radical SAM protein [Candidatus Thorarchaeota archaeon]
MKGLCPECGKLLESEEFENSGQIYTRRVCPEHGSTKSLLSTDAEYWRWARRYDRPGLQPVRWSSQVEEGCPNDCGLCQAHRQHTCIGVLEITGECNLNCNVCFADSPSCDHLPYSQIVDMINSYVSYEADPEILQLSGGEPTLHPDIIEIVRYAKSMGIGDVAVSTNGLRLLDESFASEFAEADPVVYLQFDTFRPEVSKRIRGADLVEEKKSAVETCSKLEMTTVLVPTLIAGLNDDEVGDIVRYGLSKRKIFGVNFQPVAQTGRTGIPDAAPITVHEVLKKIEVQTDGMIGINDFRPIPCPHPHCTAISYLLVDDKEVVPLTDLVNVDEYIDYAKNRTLVSEAVLMDEAFKKLFSTSAVPGTQDNLEAFCDACGMAIPEVLGKSVKTVAVHAFMDANTYQLERAQKCCIHVIRPDGKMIPFCNYNLFHRHNGGIGHG